MGRWIAALLALGVASGCRPTDSKAPRDLLTASASAPRTFEPSPPPETVDQRAPNLHLTVILLHPQRPAVAPAVALRAAARSVGARVLEDAPDGPPSALAVLMTRVEGAELDLLDPLDRSLLARGLSDAEEAALPEVRRATVLEFFGPTSAYRDVLRLVGRMARKTGGVIQDQDACMTFSIPAWEKLSERWVDDVPDVREHMLVSHYRDGELFRIVTHGMSKFGLPELTVDQVSSSDSVSMRHLVNAVGQTLIQTSTLSDGRLDVVFSSLRPPALRDDLMAMIIGEGQARYRLQLMKPPSEDGATERWLELVFEGPKDERQVRQREALTAIFGVALTSSVVDYDDALYAARAAARRRLARMEAQFYDGPAVGEQLLVKAGFPTPDGGFEWMWVEVIRWRGTRVTGLLQNEPSRALDLHAGARVRVRDDRLFDYLYRRADGTEEGNETGALIEERNRAR